MVQAQTPTMTFSLFVESQQGHMYDSGNKGGLLTAAQKKMPLGDGYSHSS
jgi:hypothetical protein